jgi:Ankyrin repeat
MSEIAIAVCTRSESKLRRACIDQQHSINVQDRNGRTPLHLAANWPCGVALLLRKGADICRSDHSGLKPLQYACMFKCLTSVQLMLEADSPLDDGQSCTTTVLSDAIESRDTQIVQSIIANLVKRRLQLQRLAEVTLSPAILERLKLRHDKILDEQAFEVQKALEDNSVPLWETLKVAPVLGSVYHVRNLDCGVADRLFNAGFHDVDSVNENGITPLMQLRSQIFRGRPIAEMLKLGIWLTSKGADISRILPNSSASVTHQIALDVGYYLIMAVFPDLPVSRQTVRQRFLDTFSDLDLQCREFLLNILTMDSADGCLCACSFHGCRTLTKLFRFFSEVVERNYGEKFGLFTADKVKTWFLESLFNFLKPRLKEDALLQREIIRFATFDRLDLTHTCCNTESPIKECLETAEVKEIR